MFASLKCVSFCDAHCIPLNGRAAMRHFSPRSQVVKQVQRKSIVRNCLLFSQGMRDQMAGRPRLVQVVLGPSRSQFVGSDLEIFFQVWGLVLLDKSVCLEGVRSLAFPDLSLCLAHCQPKRFKLHEVRFTVQKNLSIHTKFNKVRSNSNLNHDELKRLDNRFMNASQPLEDDWRKSKISSDIS